jgi:DNA-binding NarL/FixJ family response regulator
MNAEAQKSLLIIDDHPVYRDALSEKLSAEFGPRGIAVLAASDAKEGLELIEQFNHSCVVLLDIQMPGLSGLAGIKVFKNLEKVEHVVAISGLDEHAWEPKAVSAGASLFLSKNATVKTICDKLLTLLLAVHPAAVAYSESSDIKFRLTQRQLEVLDLMAQGHPNKVIADYLLISEQTVKIHVNQIFKSLQVFNRTQAVLKAQKFKFLS